MIYNDFSKYEVKEIEHLPRREWRDYMAQRQIHYKGIPIYKTHIKNIVMLREELGNPYCVERDFEFDYKGEKYRYTEKALTEYSILPDSSVEKL